MLLLSLSWSLYIRKTWSTWFLYSSLVYLKTGTNYPLNLIFPNLNISYYCSVLFHRITLKKKSSYKSVYSCWNGESITEINTKCIRNICFSKMTLGRKHCSLDTRVFPKVFYDLALNCEVGYSRRNICSLSYFPEKKCIFWVIYSYFLSVYFFRWSL